MINAGTINSFAIGSASGVVVSAQALVPGPLSLPPVSLVSITPVAAASAPTMIGAPLALAGATPKATASAPTPLRAPLSIARAVPSAFASVPGPLASPKAYADSDWSALVDPITTRQYYNVTLTGETDSLDDISLSISSWQATLQTGRSSYLQCVVPGAASLIDKISARPNGTIVLYSGAIFHDGTKIETEMARAPMDVFRYDRGPVNTTVTMSGYTNLFGDELSAAPVRALKNVRSMSFDGAGFRVRADVDLILRPGRSATAAGQTIAVSYINYYVGGDGAYMEVGERAA